MLSACQKASGNCFLGQERSADGVIHATKDHNKVRSVLRNTKKTYVGLAIQKKRCGMLTSSVVLLHDNTRPHAAARTQALLEPFRWELFYHLPYSPDLAPNDCHLLTYQKNWFRSQLFNSNE
jgi:hypothetical protein